MTLVVGVDYGSEILVFADTRVSVNKRSGHPPKDQLKKLVIVDYFLDGSRCKAVLGFSGNIRAVKLIVESLQRKAKHFRGSGNLKDDFNSWMEDAIRHPHVKAILTKHKRQCPKFMLCHFASDGKPHIHIFSASYTGEVTVQIQEPESVIGPGGRFGRGTVAVIGSGREHERRIREIALAHYGNPKHYVSPQAYSSVRRGMVQSITDHEFQEMNSETVGGPFLTFRVRRDECIGEYAWPLSPDMSNVQMTEDGERTILYNTATQEKYVLFSIFDYTEADFFEQVGASA